MTVAIRRSFLCLDLSPLFFVSFRQRSFFVTFSAEKVKNIPKGLQRIEMRNCQISFKYLFTIPYIYKGKKYTFARPKFYKERYGKEE
ncbi:MAG: hypothetical protein DSY76_09335 [Bacteroidetes bacterium]|nr:MAG: hypothetical protein DSY76_09335 [Bacteroidota bacterium]